MYQGRSRELLRLGRSPAIGHDILDFCERELDALSGGAAETKMAIIALVKTSSLPPFWQAATVALHTLAIAPGLRYSVSASGLHCKGKLKKELRDMLPRDPAPHAMTATSPGLRKGKQDSDK